MAECSKGCLCRNWEIEQGKTTENEEGWSAGADKATAYWLDLPQQRDAQTGDSIHYLRPDHMITGLNRAKDTELNI